MQMVVAEPVLSEPSDLSNPAALAAIMAALSEKFPAESISITTDIFDGLADSQAFLDIVFSVEKQTGTTFDAELLDFEGAMTPERMAQAFKVS